MSYSLDYPVFSSHQLAISGAFFQHLSSCLILSFLCSTLLISFLSYPFPLIIPSVRPVPNPSYYCPDLTKHDESISSHSSIPCRSSGLLLPSLAKKPSNPYISWRGLQCSSSHSIGKKLLSAPTLPGPEGLQFPHRTVCQNPVLWPIQTNGQHTRFKCRSGWQRTDITLEHTNSPKVRKHARQIFMYAHALGVYSEFCASLDTPSNLGAFRVHPHCGI